MAASPTVVVTTTGRRLNSRPSRTIGTIARVQKSVGSNLAQNSESLPMAIQIFSRK
jgi:hypothetical protein